jgi:hypothetical protein
MRFSEGKLEEVKLKELRGRMISVENRRLEKVDYVLLQVDGMELKNVELNEKMKGKEVWKKKGMDRMESCECAERMMLCKMGSELKLF